MAMFFSQSLHEGVVCMSLRTPTLPPATTTNTLLIGHTKLAVIEPATPYEHEQHKLTEMLAQLINQGAQLVAILITHHHHDHIGYADQLRKTFNAPLLAHAETAARVAFPIDRELHDQEIIHLDGKFSLKTLFTPGHAPGHLAFLEQSTGIAYVGDLVAGTGTIIIDPEDGGDMSAYLRSLQQLLELKPRQLVPAHGPMIHDPPTYLRTYINHRLLRESKVLAALASSPLQFDALLKTVYADTPTASWPLAARSLEAHVQKLEHEGRVTRIDSWIQLS